MKTRLVGSWAVATLLAAGSAWAAGPDSSAGGDEWRDRGVLAASPKVVLREQPNAEAAAIPISLAGVWLQVKRAEGDWLLVDWAWIRTTDAVRDDQAVEFFAAELARGESAFAYLGRSQAWLQKGEFDKAQADVSEALRLEPNNARAYLARATIAEAQERTEDDRAACERAIAIDPRDPLALNARSRLRATAGEFDGAIADLEQAIAVLPKCAGLWAARGYCWESKGEHEKALADFTAAIQLDPTAAYAFAERAGVYLQRQEYDKALHDAEQALRTDAKLPQALSIRGALRAQKGESDAALSDLDESIRLDATDALAFGYRGWAHYLKGDYDAAIIDYSQLISLDPDNADGYLRRAEVWARKGDRASAILDLTQYLRLRPQDANAYSQRGWLNKESDLDAAFDDFNAALAINPRHVGALMGRGMAWRQKNDFAKALADTNAALAAAPRNAAAYVARGWLRKVTDLDAALRDFDAALAINPRHIGALLERADVWRKKDEPDKALADLTAAIEADPKNAYAYQRRANLYTSRGDHGSAIDDLNSALRINPDDTSCLLRRSTQWSLCGDLEKALDDCRAVLAKEPKNLMAYSQMAQAHSMAGRREEALEDYAAALRVDPHDEQIRFDRAFERFNQDKFDLALADVDEVIQHGKRKADAYNWRGYFWMRKRSWDKALADFNEAIRLAPDDAEHYRMRADCRYGMKEFDKAIEDADLALRLDPALEAAAHVRKQAQEAKQDPSKWVDSQAGEQKINADDVAAGLSKAELARFYEIDLQGPRGVKLIFQNFGTDEFGPEFTFFPTRLPMLDDMPIHFKLEAIPGNGDKALYVLLKPKRLAEQEIELLRAAKPSVTLTQADLDDALARKEVTNFLVLRRREDKETAKPELEVVTSRQLDPKADPVSAASARGKILASIKLSNAPFDAAEFQLADEEIDDGAEFVGLTAEERARLYEFEIKGPEGVKASLLGGGPEEYSPYFEHFPLRVPMIDNAMASYKLTGISGNAEAALYVQLQSRRIAPQEIALLRAAKPSVMLTKAEFDAALSGKDVTKIVVLSRRESEQAAKPKLAVLSRTELDAKEDVFAEASRRGAIVATLRLGKSSPVRSRLLPDERMIRLCLRGPDGLTVARAEYHSPIPVPFHFALLPGAELQWILGGPPLGKGGAVRASVTVFQSPVKIAELAQAELSFSISQSDLATARGGKAVTSIIYLTKPEMEGETPCFQTLSSAELESHADAVAEASKRGAVLAVLLLSQELADLPLGARLERAPEVKPSAAHARTGREKADR